HGRKDLRDLITSEDFGKKAGVPVVWCEGPELCGATIAYGLALSCVTQQIGEGLDLARSLTPAPSLWGIFPWGQMAAEAALVACMGLVMVSHWRSVIESEGPLRRELAKHAWVGSKTQADLHKEQQFLSAHVDAIRKFAGTRAIWTKYTP